MRSRPFSIVRVFGLEKEHVGPGFESEPLQSSRMKVRSESMRWLGFKSWGEMLEYYRQTSHGQN